MKYVIIILAVLSIGSIGCGVVMELDISEQLIGGGVAGLFFIVFPIFIVYRWRHKNFKDYMLTEESLEEMRKRNSDL